MRDIGVFYRLLVFRFPPSVLVSERWGYGLCLSGSLVFFFPFFCIDTQSGREALSILFFSLPTLSRRGHSHSLDRSSFVFLFAAYRYNAFRRLPLFILQQTTILPQSECLAQPFFASPPLCMTVHYLHRRTPFVSFGFTHHTWLVYVALLSS
jgi:hypothetical protein